MIADLAGLPPNTIRYSLNSESSESILLRSCLLLS
jgi:hypothetical protein